MTGKTRIAGGSTATWMVVAMVVAITGCGQASGVEDDGESGLEIRPLRAQLVRATSCEQLLSEIQADAVARVDLALEHLRAGGFQGTDEVLINTPRGTGGPITAPGTGTTPGGAGPAFDTGAAMNPSAPGVPPSAGVPGAEPSPAPVASDGAAGPATEEVGPQGYSDTNRQVADVDEADIVKVDADGRFVYLLHGDRLVVLKSWPAAETALSQEVVLDRPLDGRPYEMFVKDGKVAIFSSVSDRSAFGSDGGSDAPRAVPGGCFDCYYDDRSMTKLTLLEVSEGSTELSRELYFEGTYVSSRRYDDRIRGVIRGGFKAPELYRPYIEAYDPWGNPHPAEVIEAQIEAWRERTVDAILATRLEQWLPRELERTSTGLVESDHRCGDFYIPAPGLVAYGITSIVEADLSDPEADVGGAIILGDAAHVYSNTSSLVLAHADFQASIASQEGEGQMRTVLHQFAIDESGLGYTASGFVTGEILNQFSIDELDGVVRVATTSRRWHNDGLVTDNRIRTLRADGDELEVLGETPNLGKPRETIHSARFVGDRGYVVTFEQVDPLVVVDLSSPEDPRVLGQVEIPGFSTYMHPIGADHLLTIGEFIDPITGGNRTLQLQIFDVTDPEEPRQAHSFLFPLGGNSLASQQHKAFNYFADRKLLSFPYVNWQSQESTLEVFEVDVDSGFTRRGSVDHAGLLSNCHRYPEDQGGGGSDPIAFPGGGFEQAFYACPAPSVRRGVFIDDFILSFSYGGVLVHAVAELTADSSTADAIARVDLTRPRYPDWEGNQWFGGGGNLGFRQPGIATTPTMPPQPVGTTPGTQAPAPGQGVPEPPGLEPPPDPAAPEPAAQDAGTDIAVGDSTSCERVCEPIVATCGASREGCVDECTRDMANSGSCGEEAGWAALIDCCLSAEYAPGCDSSFDACQREACGELRPAGAASGCF